MGNIKGRVDRLEGGRKGRGIAIIIVMPGEGTEEAWRRHLVQHPEDEMAEARLIIRTKGRKPPSATPSPNSEPEDSAKAPGLAPLMIVW